MGKKGTPWFVPDDGLGHKCNTCGHTRLKVIQRPFPKNNGLLITICNECLGEISKALKEVQNV